MSAEPSIRIARDELFTPDVDRALARERHGRERIVADPPPVGALRRLLHNSLIYLPLAAVLAALCTWLVLEPSIVELPRVRGPVLLVNTDPFDAPGLISLTIGDREVYVDPLRTELEPGPHGEPPLAAVDDIVVGTELEATGLAEGTHLLAAVVRPARGATPHADPAGESWAVFLLFPLTAALIALALLLAEGITTRNWLRMIQRALVGSFLAALFSVLALVPAGLILQVSNHVLAGQSQTHERLLVTVRDVSGWAFLLLVACRSAAWACIGAATGVGMNLVRSTRAQLRNSAIGGALGGGLGGLFFDPIDRFFTSSLFTGAGASRLVGLLAVGLAIGVFVALVERLSREAWLRVRTGPLAGKSFILHKTPTMIGSAPASEVYLYKDAEIDPAHAAIHQVGTTYEIEDLGTRTGTTVGGAEIRRRRLASGDQIVIGSTVLDFEERQQRTPRA